jgi:EmrB/QacA subfamily drug resistance transporter
MNDGGAAFNPPCPFRWRNLFLHGAEPPPAAFLVRRPSHIRLLIAVVCIGPFISQVDASIVQLTLPTLARTFGVPITDVRWVAISYLLASMASIPVFARLGEIHGRKLLYLIGFLVFGLSSLLCGLSPDLRALVAFRILQGIGGAMVGANSIAILTKSMDGERRAHAIGLFTATQAIGISVGPTVGGLLLASLGWQWVFWVNVPFCAMAFVAGWLVIHRTSDRAAVKTFDWPGAVLLVLALSLTILALNQVSVWPIASPLMVSCVLAAVVLLVMFVQRERRSTSPLVDIGVFARREFAAGCVCAVLSFAMLYGVFFSMSFALVHGHHDSPITAGLKLTVVAVAIGLASPASVPLSKRLGLHKVGIAAMASCAVALLVLAWLTRDSSPHEGVRLAMFALFGCGLGLFITPNNNATLDAAPPSRPGQAGGAIILARAFGSCMGISVTSSVMAWSMALAAGPGFEGALFAEQPMLAGVESALALLVLAAVATGIVSLMRGIKGG